MPKRELVVISLLNSYNGDGGPLPGCRKTGAGLPERPPGSHRRTGRPIAGGRRAPRQGLQSDQ